MNIAGKQKKLCTAAMFRKEIKMTENHLQMFKIIQHITCAFFLPLLFENQQ
jgi:hypothetical protein